MAPVWRIIRKWILVLKDVQFMLISAPRRSLHPLNTQEKIKKWENVHLQSGRPAPLPGSLPFGFGFLDFHCFQCIFTISKLFPLGKGHSRDEDFLISSMWVHYFLIISPWNSAGSFIWTSLHPYHLRMLCAKLGWYWPCGSLKFGYFIIISLWKRAGLHLKQLESPSPKDVLCQVWLKLWRRI